MTLSRWIMAPNIRVMPISRRTVLVLLLAILAASWAAPLIRMAAAPVMAIAAWRLTIASVILLPIFLATGGVAEWRARGGRDVLIAIGAGIALALHFATWITSVRLTSVAASSVLVALSPIFAWVLTHRTQDRPSSREGAGILLAVAGAVVISLGDARAGATHLPHALLGDMLALAGAVCGAIYFVIGRRLRAHLGLVAYVTPVYGTAAVILLAWAALKGEAFVAYPTTDWLVFAALAIGPMLIGHTGYNYALRHLPAWGVGAAALGEPIGATLIAWLLPAIAEPPGWPVLAGGALCLAGIGLALAGAPRRAAG